jgi:hypothetical protein
VTSRSVAAGDAGSWTSALRGMARGADDLAADPAVALIEEPTESFDARLRELLVDPGSGRRGVTRLVLAASADAELLLNTTRARSVSEQSVAAQPAVGVVGQYG